MSLAFATDADIPTLDITPQVVSSSTPAHCPTAALWTAK